MRASRCTRSSTGRLGRRRRDRGRDRALTAQGRLRSRHVGASTVIEYTYRLDNGAHVGWGAPRLKIAINGVAYSSVNQVNPDYGHANGDGTFTVSAIATTLNDNAQTPNPEGTIPRASLIYDYQDKGTVEFTNVVIDGQPISFK